MSFQFERPSWMTDSPSTKSGEIVAESGIHEKDGGNEYWKCFQRIETSSGNVRVRTAVYDKQGNGAHFSREGDFNLPAKYMGSLIEDARSAGIFTPA
jgi:hypothetical protein